MESGINGFDTYKRVLEIHPHQKPSIGDVVMGFTGGSVQQHGNRFYVQLYWNGKNEKFWSVLIQGLWHPIKSIENGDKLHRAIQEDIDRDREGFDPRSFRPNNPLCLGEYHQTWLEQIDVTTKTRRDYKTAITKYALPFFGVTDRCYRAKT